MSYGLRTIIRPRLEARLDGSLSECPTALKSLSIGPFDMFRDVRVVFHVESLTHAR